jgi:hypothetical protein
MKIIGILLLGLVILFVLEVAWPCGRHNYEGSNPFNGGMA